MRNDRSKSRNAGALKRLHERKRKQTHRAATPLSPAQSKEHLPSAELECLAGTVALTSPPKQKQRWATVPIALAIHLGVLLAFILVPMFMLPEMVPELVPLYLSFAPPPPPPLKSGNPLTVERPEDEVPEPTPDADEQDGVDQTFNPDRLAWTENIPDEILKPRVEMDFGVEDGWDFGHPLGMEGGIPGGVVGGVPGGIVGGVIGGTGTGVPHVRNPDTGPRPIRMPRPTYTVEAIRKKISGEVVLRALIDVKGKVKVLDIVRSIPELDTEAVRVVERDWLFRPATKNGRPVATIAELVVTFNLY